MNIGIIGGGSIGLLLSGYLSKKHNVTLYVNRNQQKDIIDSQQFHLLKASKPFRTMSIVVRQTSKLKREDCFIVCVKQPHIKTVISLFKGIKSEIPVLFLQNGMGHLEEIKKLSQPTYVGVVEHGAKRIADNKVNHLGDGVIKLASVTGKHEELDWLVQQLHDDTFPFERMEDWNELLKRKLIINAVINPLTALFDVPNGSVIENESIRLLARNLCEEAADVLKLDMNTSWERVLQTAANTSKNTSSMRADIQNHQKTEIEAISGYIIKRAGENNIPYTFFVYHSIVALEKKEKRINDRSTHS